MIERHPKEHRTQMRMRMKYVSRNIHTARALFCFVVIRYKSISHILQVYFTGTGVIIRLLLCQWSNPDKYGCIKQRSLLDKHNSINHHKSVCICMRYPCTWDAYNCMPTTVFNTNAKHYKRQNTVFHQHIFAVRGPLQYKYRFQVWVFPRGIPIIKHDRKTVMFL